MTTVLLDEAGTDQLRTALTAAGYPPDGVERSLLLPAGDRHGAGGATREG